MRNDDIPRDWSGAVAMFRRWLNRRVPRRFRGVVLILLLLAAVIPVVWQTWEPIADVILRPRIPTLLVLPHHDFPYGYAYWKDGKGTVERLRAYPIYNTDMHSTIGGQEIVEETDAIRDGYRITVANPTDRKFIVTSVTMRQRRYEKLPDRYVCVWSRKGVEQVLSKDFDLAPDRGETPLIGDREVVELAPGEAQVILARVRNAAPGIYTFGFSVRAQSLRGSVRTLESGEFRILVPNREPRNPAAPRGVSVAFGGDDNALVSRLLGLDAVSWRALSEATNPRSLDLDLGFDLSAAMKGNDQDLVQQLLQRVTAQLQPKSAFRTDCDASTMHAADCAPLLIALGRPEQAVRVLRDGLVREPDDFRAAAKLTQLLVHRNRLAVARNVWEDAYKRSPPNESLYDAGFDLAEESNDVALAEKLEAQTRLAFPDSERLLLRRLDLYERRERPRDALRALAVSCGLVQQIRIKSEQQVLRRAFILNAIRISNRGEPAFGEWLSSALQRCPSVVTWDLRTSPIFWHYDPSIADPVLRNEFRGADALAMARSLFAGGRARLAFMTLGSVENDQTANAELRTEAQELGGDILLRVKRYEQAGEAYLSAYRTNGLSKLRMEGIAIKAALAYYFASSKNIDAVFKVAGPYERQPSPAAIEETRARLGRVPTDLYVVYDPPRATERTYGLMMLFYAFTKHNYELAVRAVVAIFASEPVWELGQHRDLDVHMGGLMALARTMREWKNTPKTAPRLSADFLNYLAYLYTREDPIISVDEDEVGSPEGDSASMAKTAQTKFRHGFERAYGSYELQVGLKEIESALADAPENVHILRVAAQLHAALRHPQRCVDLTSRALLVAPRAAGLAQLQTVCRKQLK